LKDLHFIERVERVIGRKIGWVQEDECDKGEKRGELIEKMKMGEMNYRLTLLMDNKGRKKMMVGRRWGRGRMEMVEGEKKMKMEVRRETKMAGEFEENTCQKMNGMEVRREAKKR